MYYWITVYSVISKLHLRFLYDAHCVYAKLIRKKEKKVADFQTAINFHILCACKYTYVESEYANLFV